MSNGSLVDKKKIMTVTCAKLGNAVIVYCLISKRFLSDIRWAAAFLIVSTDQIAVNLLDWWAECATAGRKFFPTQQHCFKNPSFSNAKRSNWAAGDLFSSLCLSLFNICQIKSTSKKIEWLMLPSPHVPYGDRRWTSGHKKNLLSPL